MKRSTSTLNVVAMFVVVALGVAIPVAAQRRNQEPAGGGSRPSGGDRAVPRESSGGGDTASAPRSTGSGGSTPAAAPSSGESQRDRGGSTAQGNDRSAPTYSRPRGGQTSTGTAMARRGALPSNGSPIFIGSGYYRSYYPWGYGGYGFGGYSSGYYDPWFYGGGYGGYGGGFGYPSYYSTGYEGSLRIKVKPRDASVFVDGYFAGSVDEFDGVFQRLRVESGPHRIEIRADGYEPLSFEVRILPGHTTNYSGELKSARP